MILVVLSLFLGVSLVSLSLDILPLVNDTCSFGVVQGQITLLSWLYLVFDFCRASTFVQGSFSSVAFGIWSYAEFVSRTL